MRLSAGIRGARSAVSRASRRADVRRASGRVRRLRRCAGVITLAVLSSAPAAWPLASGPGQIKVEKTGSGFDATGTLRQDGRLVSVNGPITCTKNMALRIDVTLTQRKTGALGRGTWRGVCSGVPQRWTVVNVRSLGDRRFTAGRVTACAAAVLRNRTRPVDALQWCEMVRLKHR